MITRGGNALKFIKSTETWKGKVAVEYLKVSLWLKRLAWEKFISIYKDTGSQLIPATLWGSPQLERWSNPRESRECFHILFLDWFGWSTNLPGLQMKNATNEQLSLSPSLPEGDGAGRSDLLVWRRAPRPNCRTKTLVFRSLSLSRHVPLFFHLPSGTWNVGNLLHLPQHLPFLPRSRSHRYSIICFSCPKSSCGSHSFLFAACHPSRAEQGTLCSSTPNRYRNLPQVQCLSFYSGEWRRIRVSGEQSSSR